MGGDSNFYAGADYGFDPSFSEEFSAGFDKGPYFPLSQFSVTTDPRTANQLKAVSDKLNTGVRSIEITGISQQTLDNIPKQHWTEINRLKKLTGVDLTFHGPLVEPTGLAQNGWDPTLREAAERQMKNAIDIAHQVDPQGNTVVTFHTSVIGVEPWPRVKGKNGDELSGLGVIDERTGRFGMIPKQGKNYFEDTKKWDPYEEMKDFNKNQWLNSLTSASIEAQRGREILDRLDRGVVGEDETDASKVLDIKKLIETDKRPGFEGRDFFNRLPEDKRQIAEKVLANASSAQSFVNNSYANLQGLYNQAYESLERAKDKDPKAQESLQQLDAYHAEIKKLQQKYKKESENNMVSFDTTNQLASAVSKGLRVLQNITPPSAFKPLGDFMIDKASDTFSNVALHAFQSYEKKNGTAPIISIENPPVGQGGLDRAEDLRELIKESRRKFSQKLVDQGYSKDKAEAQAEKLIGATWDVGHINMMRKFGYNEQDTIEEAKKIAPYVKHVHLSDNFGFEHTELPMGMGNVPTQKIMELSENFKKARKVIETGSWFGPQAFGNRTPLQETLRAFNSPIYSMQMGPHWGAATGTSGGYFSGYGQTLPEQHFNMYGSGFSNMPPELGGQMGGRSRASGAPIE